MGEVIRVDRVWKDECLMIKGVLKCEESDLRLYWGEIKVEK